ncbi:MAG: hypothetical protein IT460_00900 [Planctomycetes bacterium]|nr:hypothetical protein [Planctomycetota bacterium]
MNLRSWLRVAPVALAALVCATPVRAEDGAAAPATASVKRWTLDYSHGPLRRVLVDDGAGRESSVLYMTMKVSNKTGLPRPWRPLVTAKVDTRATPYVAGGNATALVEIRRQEGNDKLTPIEATGFRSGDEMKLADGATLDLVAIFGSVDPGWCTCRIDVSGLINPITTVKVLKYGDKQVVMESAYAGRNDKVMETLRAEAKASGSDVPRPTPEYQEIQERRNFVMEYRRQGDEFRPDDDPIQFAGERWEVIGDPKVIRVIPAAG